MLVEPARGTIATFRETLAAPRPRAARKGVMRKSREMTIMTARSQRLRQTWSRLQSRRTAT